MNRIVYIASIFFASITLCAICKAHAIFKTRYCVNDTLKIDYDYIPLPRWISLQLKYHNYYYAHPRLGAEGILRTKRLDIVYEFKKTGDNKKNETDRASKKPKILYSFTHNDTLAFSAIFSTVKYDNEYYIVAFPHRDEWEDFTPPEGKDGYFLYTPIGFHLDTVKWTLTRLKYNQNLKIAFVKYKHAVIYDKLKYPIPFYRPYAFSKKGNEFVFGKVMRKYLKNVRK